VKISAAKKRFGQMLNRFRADRELTLRDLGSAADIPFAYVSLIESGQRGVGPAVAAKLADGLKLAGEQRLRFLLSAERTSNALGRKRATSGCPPFLAGLFAKRLQQLLGVDPSEIQRFECCHLRPASDTFPTFPPHIFVGYMRGAKDAQLKPRVVEALLSREHSAVAVIILRDGRQVVVECGRQIF
jgi:transcriptional regulator with XRE-family HTH domain